MVTCSVVPVIRAVRRAVVARPRVAVATLAATRAVRRVRRPLLVCRDAGALAVAGSLSATTPAGAPAPSASPAPAPTDGPDIGDVAAPPLGGAGGFGMPGGGGAPPETGAPRLDVLPKRLLFGPDSPPVPPGRGTILTRLPDPAPPVTVPEPPVLGLFLCALLAVVLLRRRWNA